MHLAKVPFFRCNGYSHVFTSFLSPQQVFWKRTQSELKILDVLAYDVCMRSLRIALVGLLVASTSIFAVSAKAADSSLTLSCVTFSWPDTIYRPLSGGNVSLNFSFKNSCAYDLLSANYKLVDKFGSIVANGGVTYFKAGVTANESENWMDFRLSQGTEPFTLQFSVENFPTNGISDPAPVRIPFKFAERTTVSPTPTRATSATPSPAATVYLTNPADQTLKDLNTSLKAQVASLNAKLKKICAVKPKPKGC